MADTTRRRFAQLLALLAATPRIGFAEDSPSDVISRHNTSPQQQPGDTDLLMQIVRRHYGAHLSDAQLAAVRSDIESQQKALERIRAVPLTNGDAPAVGFEVRRGG